MSKLTVGLGLLLVVGGFTGLAFQAWGLAGILLLIGVLTVLVEVRAHRRRIVQTRQNVDTYEVGKARAAGAVNQGAILDRQPGY